MLTKDQAAAAADALTKARKDELANQASKLEQFKKALPSGRRRAAAVGAAFIVMALVIYAASQG